MCAEIEKHGRIGFALDRSMRVREDAFLGSVRAPRPFPALLEVAGGHFNLVLSVRRARSRPFSIVTGDRFNPVLSVRRVRSRPFSIVAGNRFTLVLSVHRAFPALFNRRGQPLQPRPVRAPRVPGPEGSALARRTGRIFKPRCTFRNVSRFRRRGCVRRASSQVYSGGFFPVPAFPRASAVDDFPVPAARMRPSRIVTGFSGRCLLVPILRRASVSDFSRFRRRGCVRRASAQVFPVGVSRFRPSVAHRLGFLTVPAASVAGFSRLCRAD